MSGTSLDGVDVAFVDIEMAEGARFAVRPVASGFRAYDTAVVARLQAMRSGKPVTIGDVCEMHSVLGGIYADAVGEVAAENGIDVASIVAVGLHGQTVWHAPMADECGRGTLQIGQPAILAERLGARVVSDFRAADMAAGGQGAPLVPFADFALFSSMSETRAVLNIGGIANLTYLSAGGTLDDVLGFDTGPGNLLIDGLARRLTGKPCDEAGALAGAGAPVMPVVEEFLGHAYFQTPPPKSTGAELFGADAVARLSDRLRGRSTEDGLATATCITAESIARAVDRWLPRRPERIIVGGGGLHNKTLMRYLNERLARVTFDPHEAHGIPSDGKEAIAFALLACARTNNIPANVPSVTGARGRRLLGVMTERPTGA